MTESHSIDSERDVSAFDSLIGTLVLGRYRIVKRLAEGGMGVVYLGRLEGAAGFARPVIIKRVLLHLVGRRDSSKMFVREARILANLRHSGIVGIVDFGEEHGAHVMVLEYVHGYDAGAWLKYLELTERRVPIDIALQIAIKTLEGLHYAHTLKRPDGTALHIVHRDVSPNNILLDTEGHVRLADFGIARMTAELDEYRTQETTFKGKLGYAHPSLLSRGEPSPQTDVYSAAVVLFHLLTGENPFRGPKPADSLERVLHLPLPRLRGYDLSLPQSLDDVVSRGMARDLRQGFADAQAMAEALRRLRSESEADVQLKMAALLSEDFRGDLPRTLRIDALTSREAAWRKSVIPRAERLESSRSQPSVRYDGQTVIDCPKPALDTRLQRPLAERARAAAVVLTIGAAIVGAGFGSVVIASRGSTAAETDPHRYVIVTSDDGSQSVVQTEPQPPNEPQNPDPSGAARPILLAPTQPGPSPSSPAIPEEAPVASQHIDPKTLTRRFARHDSGVQTCLAQDLELIRTHSALEISFSVDAHGKPRSAHLVPNSLDTTSVGACLLDIARKADFGELGEPLNFRIPIHAELR